MNTRCLRRVSRLHILTGQMVGADMYTPNLRSEVQMLTIVLRPKENKNSFSGVDRFSANSRNAALFKMCLCLIPCCQMGKKVSEEQRGEEYEPLYTDSADTSK